MAGDKSIICIVERLNCPVLYSEISELSYDSYGIIKDSGIVLIHSWPTEDKIADMYKGKDNGYMAVL